MGAFQYAAIAAPGIKTMPDLSSFPITQRWPATHPDRLQLYAAPTPNGVKVSIMLEETGLAYEPHLVDMKRPGFRGGSNTGEWSHEEVLEVFA